jgi:hypothetical protein
MNWTAALEVDAIAARATEGYFKATVENNYFKTRAFLIIGKVQRPLRLVVTLCDARETCLNF